MLCYRTDALIHKALDRDRKLAVLREMQASLIQS